MSAPFYDADFRPFATVRHRARARLHPSRLQQLPRPLSIPGKSAEFQFSGQITQNFKQSQSGRNSADSPGMESGRGSCWSRLGWRRALAGAVQWRMDENPHRKTDFRTSWDIKATPTFFFLRDGQQVDKLVGANKVELQKKIVAIVDSAPCKK
ncbi:hypothetical protein ACLB2K_056171 [Fragaria x ananassa]